MSSEAQKHPYHLVDPSPWPLAASAAAFLATFGAVLSFHKIDPHHVLLIVGLISILLCAFGWWKDVIKESFKYHTIPVRKGLQIGVGLFIASEVMFFVSFFWAYFDAALLPKDAIGNVWPPKNIKTLDAFGLPYFNTLLLLLSSSTLTWAQKCLKENNRRDMLLGLGLTIVLGLTFTIVQAIEYHHAPFAFKDGIYPSTFYMATGFHGLHVIVGTIFLIVCWVRAYNHSFTAKHHIGFQAAEWYWHFVDVVWLFLFTWVYVWGS